jgi:small subunit ribosomal protein S15
MAKLHSRKKGKAGRKRPKAKVPPAWLSANQEEIKEAIRNMVKEGIAPSKIGIMLRDRYGVPNVKLVLGVTLSQFLKKEGLAPEYPEDLMNLIKKAVKMREHLKLFKKDISNKVKLSHVESKIHRLVKYYTRTGKLPPHWKYDPEKAALLVKQ